MIARLWRGTATLAKADAYRRHFVGTVVPHLNDIAGHHGAYLLERQVEGRVEFLAVTFWDSIENVKKFAGPNPDLATVEPEGRAALSAYDDLVTHYGVVHGDT